MLHLRLSMFLSIPQTQVGFEPHGPLFHQWLPNGSTDAISIVTPSAPNSPNSLSVWFNRRGYIDNELIKYVSDRDEVDESIMRRQGWLDAGPLVGKAAFMHVSQSEFMALQEDRRGSEEYMNLGKRVIEFLFQPLHAFIETLRLQYGQYWLEELRPWDSRQHSLGGYCQSTFFLRWHESESGDWKPFLPDEPRLTLGLSFLPSRGYDEYLTEQDWREIQASFSPISNIPLALRVAGRAHELAELGHFAEAFIQAVTALELSVEHFLTKRSALYGKFVCDLTAGFTQQPLKQQLAILSIATNLGESVTLQDAMRGVDTRNRIVHEAIFPSEKNVSELYALLKCSQLLLGLNEFKTPSLIKGNKLAAPPKSPF